MGQLNLRLTPDEYLTADQFITGRLPPGTSRFRVLRCAIDARGKGVSFELIVGTDDDAEEPPAYTLREPDGERSKRIVVVGAGPAGLGCAVALVEAGYRPLVLDRGQGFPGRHVAVKRLRWWGKLDGEPPYTCGLGGAGTYSDGKLHTRKRGPEVRKALAVMASFAGSPEVLVETHPHVGSNRLPAALERLRLALEERGTEFRFGVTVESLSMTSNRVSGVVLDDGTKVGADAVVLAPGNSSRRLFSSLHEQSVSMSAKPLAVGVRIEHPRELIDRIQYGQYAGHPALDAARYAFAFSDLPRAVFSFCMCPGGHLLPVPPEPGHLAVNGMSFSTRSSAWSNAAVVAQVGPTDYGAAGVLAGIAFQRALEACAFSIAGDYRAPAQRAVDFLAGTASWSLPESSYKPGLVPARLDQLLPDSIVSALRTGLEKAHRRLPGFLTRDALLVGPETLTSSPVRIDRDSNFQSTSHPGLYPCGEGSGWAGGITSSMADGLRVGDQVGSSIG
jgi:uncharacterized protein